MTADEVRKMSNDYRLDMDYFLNEDVFDGLDGKDGFTSFNHFIVSCTLIYSGYFFYLIGIAE
jgi:hypothetical protein